MWNQPRDRLVTGTESPLLSVQCIISLPATLKENARNKCTCLPLLWMIKAECTAVFLRGMRKHCWNAQTCYIKCNFRLFFELKCILHEAAWEYFSKDPNKWDIPLSSVHMLMPSLMKYTMRKKLRKMISQAKRPQGKARAWCKTATSCLWKNGARALTLSLWVDCQ